MFSCDAVNREITNIIAEESIFITGKEYLSENEVLEYLTELISMYHEMFGRQACNKTA